MKKKELAIVYFVGMIAGASVGALYDTVALKLKIRKQNKTLNNIEYLYLELGGLTVYLSKDNRDRNATKEDINDWMIKNKETINSWLLENKGNMDGKWTQDEKHEELRKFANSL